MTIIMVMPEMKWQRILFMKMRRIFTTPERCLQTSSIKILNLTITFILIDKLEKREIFELDGV